MDEFMLRILKFLAMNNENKNKFLFFNLLSFFVLTLSVGCCWFNNNGEGNIAGSSTSIQSSQISDAQIIQTIYFDCIENGYTKENYPEKWNTIYSADNLARAFYLVENKEGQ